MGWFSEDLKSLWDAAIGKPHVEKPYAWDEKYRPDLPSIGGEDTPPPLIAKPGANLPPIGTSTETGGQPPPGAVAPPILPPPVQYGGAENAGQPARYAPMAIPALTAGVAPPAATGDLTTAGVPATAPPSLVPGTPTPATGPTDRYKLMQSINRLPSYGPGSGVTPTPAEQPYRSPEEAKVAELTDINRRRKGLFMNKEGKTIEMSDPASARKKGYDVTIREPGAGVNKKWSTWEKIASALAGWAQGGLAGGIMAGTDRNYFQKLGDQRELGRVLPAIETQNQMAMRQAQIQNEQMKPAIEQARLQQDWAKARLTSDTAIYNAQQRNQSEAEKWDKYVDPETGQVYKMYKNGKRPNEKLYDDEGKPVIDPRYNWTDPITGQNVKLGGKDFTAAQAPIIQGNATREQQARQQYSQQEFEAQKTNLAANNAYNKQVFDLATSIAKQNGETSGSIAAAEGFRLHAQKLADELGNIDANSDPAGYRQKVGELNDAQKSFIQEMGKYNSGRIALEQLQQQNIQPPGEIRAVGYTPVRIGGGSGPKVAIRANIPAFAKKNNWSVKQATDWLTNNGYTIQ